MKKIIVARIWARLVLVFLVLGMLALLVGCSAKHKITDRTKFKKAFTVERLEAVTVFEKEKVDSALQRSTKTTTVKSDQKIDVKGDGSGKPLKVTEEINGNTRTITAENASSISLGSYEEKTMVEDTLSKNVSSEREKETASEVVTEIEADESGSSRSTDTWSTRPSTWIVIFIILFIAWWLYRQYKKTTII